MKAGEGTVGIDPLTHERTPPPSVQQLLFTYLNDRYKGHEQIRKYAQNDHSAVAAGKVSTGDGLPTGRQQKQERLYREGYLKSFNAVIPD